MTRERGRSGENHVMKTLLAILLAGGGIATSFIAAPSHRSAGVPIADPMYCASASVQLPQTVGGVDGLIASAGAPTSASYGTCATGVSVSVHVLGNNIPVPVPG